MSNLDIFLFVRVAETFSFKEAATFLRISRSQVSKRIAALEQQLGTALIYRTPRSMSLTSAGEMLLQRYRSIFQLMEEARRAVEDLSTVPGGRLRFSMPTCLGSTLLPGLYAEFLPRCPGIILDAHVSERCVDVVGGGYDVALRVAQRLSDSTLTARRLGTSPLALAASPAYLGAQGEPSHPSHLARYRCLTLNGEGRIGMTWSFRECGERISVPIGTGAASDTHLALVRYRGGHLRGARMPLAGEECSPADQLRAQRAVIASWGRLWAAAPSR